MYELNDLLKPLWGPQKWIAQGWNQITDDEKQVIKLRMDEMFNDGLPFDLKHDKLIYIHTFALLAQLEVIAIQIPLKFELEMTTPVFRQLMRTQLLDELFHSMVFTKITYMLCEPHAVPPAINENIEKFCEFIRNETCPKVAVVLLNLVAEGWIEELFKTFKDYNIAPKVFDIILEDEHRHVGEADLYCEIGLPDKKIITAKLEIIEELFFSTMFFQYNMGLSLTDLFGLDGMSDYVQSMHNKHISQLKKLQLTPGKQWLLFMNSFPGVLKQIQCEKPIVHEVPMTPLRNVLMSQWSDPKDPTMVAQFNLDVTCLDLFNKKYPPETLTILMLQTISQVWDDNPDMRLFLHHKKLYHVEDTYVGLVVKLPRCNDHLGNIIFQNCHKISSADLFNKIQLMVRMMAYCYKKREHLEREHPWLKSIQESMLCDMTGSVYGAIQLRNPVVSLSNIGAYGYAQAKSPLLASEAVKITLMTVDRRQVWSKINNVFEVQDQLPVSISADHRVFDGNVPVPKMMNSTFQTVFQRMKPYTTADLKEQNHMLLMQKKMEQLLDENLAVGYMLLTTLQTMWPEYLNIEALFENNKTSTLESA